MLHHPFFCLSLIVVLWASSSQAMESAKILPKGVRSFQWKVVDTYIDQKTDRTGVAKPLAEPLNQDLTFRRIANGEDPAKGNLLRGFLLSEGIDLDTSVGQFDADLKARLQVTAPIMAYGLTEKVTLAIAVPYYRAATDVSVGFKPNTEAQRFLAALARPENNQVASAREAGEKINEAVARLNEKLVDNGFSSLGPWQDEGLGDITLAAKAELTKGVLATKPFAASATTGVVAPTGRVDDPDILTDVAFGQGQWDIFGQISLDEDLWPSLTFNQSIKYTHQLQGQKKARLITDDEKIEVDSVTTRFKPGDKWETSASVQWQPSFGLVSGVGLAGFKKLGDTYKTPSLESNRELKKGTDEWQQNLELMLGYSTLPMFRQGEFPLPLEFKVMITEPIASQNSPVTRLTEANLVMFF